jgi:hypothetical protein
VAGDHAGRGFGRSGFLSSHSAGGIRVAAARGWSLVRSLPRITAGAKLPLRLLLGVEPALITPVLQTAGFGAQQKLVSALGGFRFCPIPFSNGSRTAARYERYGRLLGCLRSLRAHLALDGVSWVQSGSIEIAVGQTDRMLQNRRRHLPLPGRRSASGARFDLLFG